eukprot:35978_1
MSALNIVEEIIRIFEIDKFLVGKKSKTEKTNPYNNPNFVKYVVTKDNELKMVVNDHTDSDDNAQYEHIKTWKTSRRLLLTSGYIRNMRYIAISISKPIIDLIYLFNKECDSFNTEYITPSKIMLYNDNFSAKSKTDFEVTIYGNHVVRSGNEFIWKFKLSSDVINAYIGIITDKTDILKNCIDDNDTPDEYGGCIWSLEEKRCWWNDGDVKEYANNFQTSINGNIIEMKLSLYNNGGSISYCINGKDYGV